MHVCLLPTWNIIWFAIRFLEKEKKEKGVGTNYLTKYKEDASRRGLAEG